MFTSAPRRNCAGARARPPVPRLGQQPRSPWVTHGPVTAPKMRPSAFEKARVPRRRLWYALAVAITQRFRNDAARLSHGASCPSRYTL